MTVIYYDGKLTTTLPNITQNYFLQNEGKYFAYFAWSKKMVSLLCCNNWKLFLVLQFMGRCRIYFLLRRFNPCEKTTYGPAFYARSKLELNAWSIMEVPEWTLSLTMPGKTKAHTGILSGGEGRGGVGRGCGRERGVGRQQQQQRQ